MLVLLGLCAPRVASKPSRWRQSHGLDVPLCSPHPALRVLDLCTSNAQHLTWQTYVQLLFSGLDQGGGKGEIFTRSHHSKAPCFDPALGLNPKLTDTSRKSLLGVFIWAS